MKVLINGKEEHLKDGMSVGVLLVERKIRREVVVIELNGNILKREDYDSVLLKDGDSVELVYYMGGGAKSVERRA
ncbi:MAG: sulfur carrier protein ThiS [Candidatus Latescibacteria bacterium]|nr:sulfur carrier protein ThiS [Candidatus Latescibacterota bacterium]